MLLFELSFCGEAIKIYDSLSVTFVRGTNFWALRRQFGRGERRQTPSSIMFIKGSKNDFPVDLLVRDVGCHELLREL